MKNAGGRCGVLRGGENPHELILNPWRTEIEYLLNLKTDSKEKLIAKIRGFMHDCVPDEDPEDTGVD